MAQKKLNFVFLFFLTLISFVYLFIRFYHLSTLLDFRLDQSFFLLESKSTIQSPHLRLLGPATSKIFDGRQFFVGSNYYYILGIVGLISHWDPLITTIVFIILEFLFYLFFVFFLKQKFNSLWSLLIFFCLSISPYLVAHSRFFWNPHLLIPLSILTIYFLDKFLNQKKFLYLFLSAFFWGFAFSCHYSPIFWLPIFIYFLIKSKNFLKLISYIIIFFGIFIGDLLFFIFELRHQFYNLKTFIYVYTHSTQKGGLTSHYFVFPLLIFVIYFLLLSLSKIKNKTFANFLLLFNLIFLTVFQFKLYPNFPSFGVIKGWNYPDQLKVANLISQNCPTNFNIAATMQGDTRAYDLRYLLSLKNCQPLGVEDYPISQKLFLIAPNNRPPESETVWEVASFKPFKINQKIILNDQLIFYELNK